MTFIKENLAWIIPLIATCIIIWITNEQKKQQKIQNCISLMEKRAKMYYEFKEFVASSTSSNEIDMEEFKSFQYKTRETELLFKSDIEGLKTEISKKVMELHVVQCKIKNTPEHCYDAHLNLAHREFELTTEISNYIVKNILFDAFKHYIDLRDYKMPEKLIDKLKHKICLFKKQCEDKKRMKKMIDELGS